MEWSLLYVIATHEETKADVERIAKAYPRLNAIGDVVARLARTATAPKGLHARRRAPAVRT
ncbi:hypothetical protein ABN028_06835 [Actinopolymorpha sp. B17G11]|uniref:hypothetical protein n=1 Tax=unclassified Actinopolymorpha TaxID=2627063 RepID=UPI0032D91BCA